MQLIERYILRQVISAFLLTVATLVMIMWLTQALGRVGLIVSEGQSLLVFMWATLLAMPALLQPIMPVALFIAAIYVLNRLNADSELVVIAASGTPRRKIVAPFIAIGMAATALSYLLSVQMIPDAARELRSLLTEARADLLSSVITEGRFVQSGPLTFHIRERGADGVLRGVIVHDQSNPGETNSYLAEEGYVVRDPTDAQTYLVMRDGSVQRRSGAPDKVAIVAFDQYIFDLSDVTQQSANFVAHARERPTRALLDPDESERYYWENRGVFRAELNDRFTKPLYPLVFVLIAVATVGFARTTRQGRGQAIVIAIVLVTGVRICGFAMLNLAKTETWAVYGLYAVPISAILVAGMFAFGNVPALSGMSAWIARQPWFRSSVGWLADQVPPGLKRRLASAEGPTGVGHETTST